MPTTIDEEMAEPQPLPRKRSLFSKATIAKVTPEEEAVAFFSRAQEVFPQRLLEEQRKREKKLQRSDRKQISASVEIKESSPPVVKKRKLSRSDSHAGYSSDASDGEPSSARRESANTTPGSASKPRQRSNSKAPSPSPSALGSGYTQILPARRDRSPAKSRTATHISLLDSDSDDDVFLLKSPHAVVLEDDEDYDRPEARILTDPSIEDEDQLSEEEFPELVQQAREREKLKQQQRLNAVKEQNHSAKDDIFQLEPTVDDDPVVEILITSKMEGTKALMVRRKLNQRLREVRYSWCDKQDMKTIQTGESLKEVIFLTWKGTRLYDSTTCRGLPGLSIDRGGKLSSEGEGFDANGKLHFEAWTTDAFEVQKRRNAARLKKEQDGSDDEETKKRKQEESAMPKCKLIMKAKGMEPFKLMVKPHTTIEKMICAFRNSKDVPDDKEISLYFDGDKLDPESTIAETELGDLENTDTVEVHIK